MKDDQVVEELNKTVADLKKRLGAVARMYGKAQIELCSFRRRLGEGSDSELRKKTRAATAGPWISPEEALPKSGERVLARMRSGEVYLLKFVEPEGMERLGMWVDRGWHSFERPAGWLPIPE